MFSHYGILQLQHWVGHAAEAAAAEVEADECAFSNVIILFRRYLIKTNLSSEYQVFCM